MACLGAERSEVGEEVSEDPGRLLPKKTLQDLFFSEFFMSLRNKKIPYFIFIIKKRKGFPPFLFLL
jgi:hypothetical protein